MDNITFKQCMKFPQLKQIYFKFQCFTIILGLMRTLPSKLSTYFLNLTKIRRKKHQRHGEYTRILKTNIVVR